MNLGHGQRRSVLILWLWTAILSGSVLYPAFTDARTPLIPIGISAIALALFTVLHPEVRRRRGPDPADESVPAGEDHPVTDGAAGDPA